MRPYTEALPWTPYAILQSNVRRLIPTSHMGDLYEYDKAWSEFSRAQTAFRLNANRETFRELNGTYARFDRLMKQAEEKYGALR